MDGEDLQVKKYFNNKKDGFYIDVGAYHPVHRNNTMLLYENGWEGINVDISYFSIKLFNHLRPKDTNLNLAISKTNGYVEMYYQKKLSQLPTIKKENANNVFTGKIKNKKILSKTLTEVLNKSKYSEKKIDFLDIDAEGADLDVLESLDFSKYSPELICVEYIGKDKKDSNIFKFLINNGYENIWSGVFSHLFKRNQGV
tara:strand:- start:1524 stop:2120 length:597 start_codon:yes stop_codon:yes gene_type:complete